MSPGSPDRRRGERSERGDALLPAPFAWDERSDVAPAFHRVDDASYRSLLEEAQSASRPAWRGAFGGPAAPLHLMTGSVAAALAELRDRQ